MRWPPVARFFVFSALAMAAAMLMALAFAAPGSPEWSAFAVGSLAAAAIGAGAYGLGLGFTDRAIVRGGIRELMLALVLFWGGMPILAGLPFLLLGMSPGQSWFEAVAALTTTGAWHSEPGSRSSDAGLIYRSALQWVGGLVSLSTAAAVFMRPEFIGVAPLIPPFSRGESGSFLRAFDQAIRAFVFVYLGCTLLGAVALIAAGVPVVPAIAGAFSLLASGGLLGVTDGPVALGLSAQVVVAILMALGAINFVVVVSLVRPRGGTLRFLREDETPAFVMLALAIGLLFWVSAGAGDIDEIPVQIFNAIGVLSTNGLLMGEAPPLPPVLLTAVIGGAAISTAGGVKLYRWLVTIRRTGDELWRLAHPGAVTGALRPVNELGVWIHALAFAVLLAALILLTSLFGYSFETSVTTTVAVVTNSGPLLALAPDMAADYGVFDGGLRVILAVGMIAGRLELVIFTVLLSRRFWTG